MAQSNTGALKLSLQQQTDQVQAENLVLEQKIREVLAGAAEEKEGFRETVRRDVNSLVEKHDNDLQDVQQARQEAEDHHQRQVKELQHVMQNHQAAAVQCRCQLIVEHERSMAATTEMMQQMWDKLCGSSSLESAQSEVTELAAELANALTEHDEAEKDKRHWMRYCQQLEADIVRLECEQDTLKKTIAQLSGQECHDWGANYQGWIMPAAESDQAHSVDPDSVWPPLTE